MIEENSNTPLNPRESDKEARARSQALHLQTQILRESLKKLPPPPNKAVQGPRKRREPMKFGRRKESFGQAVTRFTREASEDQSRAK